VTAAISSAANGSSMITYGTGRYPPGRNMKAIRKTIITATGRTRFMKRPTTEARVPTRISTWSSCHHCETVAKKRLPVSNTEPLASRVASWNWMPSSRLTRPAPGSSSPLTAASAT
jgi:hypothetical protein